MSYTYTWSRDVLSRALTVVRGPYQRALVMGDTAWSGATLGGTARRYGGVYAASRASVAQRIDETPGLASAEVLVGSGGRRTVLLAATPAQIAVMAASLPLRSAAMREAADREATAILPVVLADAAGEGDLAVCRRWIAPLAARLLGDEGVIAADLIAEGRLAEASAMLPVAAPCSA